MEKKHGWIGEPLWKKKKERGGLLEHRTCIRDGRNGNKQDADS